MERKRRIVPPVYLTLTIIVMALLHFLAPGARLIAPPYNFLGLVPVVLGFVMAGIAAGAFARAGTPVVPFERSTALVTDGIYRVTRNPMYLGMILVLIGTAVLFGTVTPWLPVPVFIWIIQTRFVRAEERFLEELFGEEYLAYRRRVRRWL
ncbi:MAG: isoprenylcysteine carboxylmethyltransferase family protein [Pseudomonadota bacterium]|jgi:Putative protein-S-isoprenylcysteine methyltransferase|nr:MAG: isoprenylcysteine carboxylmethyltransferase family protein [Pseudomonadota bacterium]